MAATKPQNPEDKKTMDVASPGKSTPDESGRPIIVTHRPMVQDPMVKTKDVEASKAPGAATLGERVIQPPSKSAEAEEPAAAETIPDEPTDEKPPESSDSAVARAVADQATSGKPKTEEALSEEEKDRQTALQKLIDEEKYFVPIGQVTRRRKNRRTLIVLLLLLLLIAGAYAAEDAGYINSGFKLPYHFFKQTSQVSSGSQSPTIPKTTISASTSTLQDYKNTDSAIGFKYPAEWKVLKDQFKSNTDSYERILVAGPKQQVALITQDGDGIHRQTAELFPYIKIYTSKTPLNSFSGFIEVKSCSQEKITIPGLSGVGFLKLLDYQGNLYRVAKNEFVLATTDCSNDKLPKVQTGFQGANKNYYEVSIIYGGSTTQEQLKTTDLLLGNPTEYEKIKNTATYKQALDIIRSIQTL